MTPIRERFTYKEASKIYQENPQITALCNLLALSPLLL